MNIFDDTVKKYNNAFMKQHHLSKHSQEYRVLATLRYLFPGQFDNMVHGDRPDLQDEKNSVGIEVTLAVRATEMQVTKEFSKMCLASSEEKKLKYQKKIESTGYEVVQSPVRRVISPTGTSDVEKNVFQESIKRKIKKARQYRDRFSILGLAVLLIEIPTSTAERSVGDWTFEVLGKDNNAFDFVYVISERFCHYYEIKTGRRNIYNLSKEEKQLLCTIGRMTAEGFLTLEDPVWS